MIRVLRSSLEPRQRGRSRSALGCYFRGSKGDSPMTGDRQTRTGSGRRELARSQARQAWIEYVHCLATLAIATASKLAYVNFMCFSKSMSNRFIFL